eukprot:9736245-Alexandrium_andersonii.AAC.1
MGMTLLHGHICANPARPSQVSRDNTLHAEPPNPGSGHGGNCPDASGENGRICAGAQRNRVVPMALDPGTS